MYIQLLFTSLYPSDTTPCLMKAPREQNRQYGLCAFHLIRICLDKIKPWNITQAWKWSGHHFCMLVPNGVFCRIFFMFSFQTQLNSTIKLTRKLHWYKQLLGFHCTVLGLEVIQTSTPQVMKNTTMVFHTKVSIWSNLITTLHSHCLSTAYHYCVPALPHTICLRPDPSIEPWEFVILIMITKNCRTMTD